MSSHFNNPKTNSNLTHINQNLFFSPKHSLNEIIEKNRLNRLEEEKFIEKNEKLKFPQVSSYITRMNFNYDQARSDGFKGFKMVLKPVRRSFEELVLKKTELAPNNQEVEDLKKFKDEIGIFNYNFFLGDNKKKYLR